MATAQNRRGDSKQIITAAPTARANQVAPGNGGLSAVDQQRARFDGMLAAEPSGVANGEA